MKKIVLLLMCFMLLIGLVACTNSKNPVDTGTNVENESESTVVETSTEEPTTEVPLKLGEARIYCYMDGKRVSPEDILNIPPVAKSGDNISIDSSLIEADAFTILVTGDSSAKEYVRTSNTNIIESFVMPAEDISISINTN